MRRLFLLAAVLCLSLCVNAQDYEVIIGAHAGVNIANVSKNRGNARPGFFTGVSGLQRLNQHFGVSAGVSINDVGFFTQAEDEAKMTYLELPVQFNVFVGRRTDLPLRIRLHGGLAPVFLMAECGVAVEGKVSDVGLQAVVGYAIEYRLAGRVWFRFDGLGQTGLLDYRHSDFRSGERQTVKNLQFSIGLGYVLH